MAVQRELTQSLGVSLGHRGSIKVGAALVDEVVQGRPKTDRLDAVWLCKVAERQMIRPSFVPPQPIRHLRDLTRYRVALVADASAEKNRDNLREAAGSAD